MKWQLMKAQGRQEIIGFAIDAETILRTIHGTWCGAIHGGEYMGIKWSKYEVKYDQYIHTNRIYNTIWTGEWCQALIHRANYGLIGGKKCAAIHVHMSSKYGGQNGVTLYMEQYIVQNMKHRYCKIWNTIWSMKWNKIWDNTHKAQTKAR